MKWIYQHPAWFFTGFILLLSAWYAAFPDILPYNGGFGFEGALFYKAVVKDCYNAVVVRGINAYSIQRILPFVVAHYVLRGLQLPLTDAVILHYFMAYNALVAVAIIYYWHRLSQLFALRPAAIWVGYLGLVVSYATLKGDFYLPFNYDRTAVLIGIMSLYYHLAGQWVRLLVVALASLAVWPTALYCNLLLLLLPLGVQLPTAGNRTISGLWAVGSGLGFAALCILVIYISHIKTSAVAPTATAWLPLSILLAAAYIAVTQYGLARVLLGSRAQVRHIGQVLWSHRVMWLAAAVLIGCYLLLTKGLGTQGHQHLNGKTFLVNVVYGAVNRPAQFIISHSNYFGLPVVLALVYWRQMGSAVRQMGLAVGGLFVLMLLLSVNSETRQLSNLLPVLVLATALVVQQLSPPPRAIAYSLLIGLVLSRFWLYVNQFDPTLGQPNDPFPMAVGQPGAEYVWNSPHQAFLMNLGPWTSNQFLLIEGVVLVLLLLVVRRLYGKPQGSPQL